MKQSPALTTSCMIIRAILVILLSFTIGLSYGQEFSYPVIIQNGKTIRDFAPPGWTILDSAKGDLNNDKLSDEAIILQHTDHAKLPNDSARRDDGRSADTVIVKHRILIILFKNPNNRKYDLAEQNNSFIIAGSDPSLADGPPLMEDPYQEIKIEGGILQIKFGLSYSTGSWWINNTAYKFRYQQNHFALIGANYYSANRASHEYYDYSFNFLTKRLRLEMEAGEKSTKKVSWKSLDIGPLKTLQSFKAPFTWEIEQDVRL
jgi:hypothetical protein